MRMCFVVICIKRMIVDGFILLMDVGMGVTMRMGMGVYQIAVPVFVDVSMRMFMGVLQTDGVLDHKAGCNDHDDEP